MNRFIRKSFTSLVLVGALLSSLIPMASAATVTDTDNHWAAPVITKWLKEGLIKGYDDGSFRPNNVITRAEAASLINRKFNITDAKEGKPFKDLASDAWQYGPLTAAAEAGYIQGYEDETIRPDGVLTRQELAVVITDLLGLETDKEDVSAFVDAAEIPKWSKKDIAAVAAQQIMDGYEDGTFAPTRTVTRAEAVVTLDRAANFMRQKGPIVYATAGVYGPEQGKKTVYQDVSINQKGVTLRNMTIYGDLVLGEGIGEGDVTLQNVTVQGQTTVKGGGANSIHFENSALISVIVDKKNGAVRIVATGTTSVQTVDVRSSVTIQEDRASGPGFTGIILGSQLGHGAEVKLDGDFDNVQVASKGTKFQLLKGSIVELGVAKEATGNEFSLGEKGTVKQLIVYTVIHVIGQGTIEKASVNEGAEATTFEKMPTMVNDKPSTAPVAGGGGGGGFVTSVPTPENITMTVSASGYKTLGVSFSGAVDPATTTITIRMPQAGNTIAGVQYSSDHKRATVSMSAAFTAGTYTLVVASSKTGGFGTLSQNVEIKDEQVISLAYVLDSAIWDERTPNSIKVKYKLMNQYGEDATPRYGNEVKVSFSPLEPNGANTHPDQGSAIVNYYSSLAENDTLDLYAFYGDNLSVTKNLKVSKSEIPATSPGTPFVFSFKVGGIYNPENKALTVDSNFEDFSILFHWKGESEITSSNFAVFSSNSAVDVKRNGQSPVLGTATVDNKEWSTLTLVRNPQYTLNPGVYVFSIVDISSGSIVSVMITINSGTATSLAANAVIVVGDTLLAKYYNTGDFSTSEWSLQGNVTSSVYEAKYVNSSERIGKYTIQGSPIPFEMYTAIDSNHPLNRIQTLMIGTETVNGSVYGKVYYSGSEKVLAVINNTYVDSSVPATSLKPLVANDVMRLFYPDKVMLTAKWDGLKWVYTGMVNRPLATPSGIRITTTSDTSISLNWSPVARADYYKVYVCGAYSDEFVPVKDALGNDLKLTSTSYEEGNLLPGTTRSYYVVAAMGGDAWEVASDISDVVTARTNFNDHIALDFQVAGSVQHPSLPIVYLTDKQNAKLYAVNYETGVKTSLSLPLPPESLTFANGKIYVSLLKGGHTSDTSDDVQKGAIAIVDASTFTLDRTFDVNIDPFDIAVDRSGYIYVSSGSGQWTQIKSYSPITFQEVSSTGIRQASYIDMHPALDRIYAITTDLYPRDMEVFNVSNGMFTPAGYDSPYHGDYSMSTNLRISPDGQYLFNGAGTVFSANENRSDDMKYVYSLDGGFSDIAFELNNRRFYTASYGSVNAYQYDDFEKYGTYRLDGSSQFLYNSPDQLISVSLIRNNYAIELIKKDAIQIIPPVQHPDIYLHGIVSDIVYDTARQKAYALDEAFHKLYVVNLGTNAVEQTISLSHKPSELTLSEDGSKLYIRNNDANVLVTEISLSNLQELRQLNYQTPPDTSDAAHGQIYQKGNYLYVVTGEWAPRLLVFNASTFAKVDYGTEINSIGDIAFSSDNTQLYYWFQYGWSAGLGNSDVYKVSIGSMPFTQVDRSQVRYPDELDRDPLDTPMLLLENRDLVIAKDHILNKNNLSETVKVMPEPIYAVSPDGNTLVGKNGLYDAHTYQKLQSLSLTGAKYFFYANGKLYYLIGNTLSHL
ncbi:hypothetical protein A8709_09370 [Paenibacillus pectinilyticus]|uniref:S-layer protein n=1 Tax=Paenibacillus pectinilyticus TaxID=512399 RepID=A0A1C1A5J6_9BACL|nr:S-layer homology domain-containing protein [Paenibacillus pectinilyticus]OCT15828.1 hypothetical protein A8709_09370 [Paenibacillus pectinilyticus]